MLTSNFNKIPPKVRNELLLGLGDSFFGSQILTNVLLSNFNKILPKVKDKSLLKLIDNLEYKDNFMYISECLPRILTLILTRYQRK